MASTKFKGVIKRSIKVVGVQEPVIVLLSDSGIEMSLKGFKTKLFASWEQVAKHMLTPANVPSYLMGKPIEFLTYQAKKLQDKGGT